MCVCKQSVVNGDAVSAWYHWTCPTSVHHSTLVCANRCALVVLTANEQVTLCLTISVFGDCTTLMGERFQCVVIILFKTILCFQVTQVFAAFRLTVPVILLNISATEGNIAKRCFLLLGRPFWISVPCHHARMTIMHRLCSPLILGHSWQLLH